MVDPDRVGRDAGSEPSDSRESRIAQRTRRRNGRVLLITALAAILFLLMSRLGG